MNTNPASYKRPFYPNQKNGFTVIELMVVVVIIGIISAFAKAPLDRYLQTLRQKSVLTEIKQMLLSARSRALANPGVHCGAYFDISTRPQKVVIFNDDFSPSSYTFDRDKDKTYLTAYPLPQGFTVKIDSGYKPEIIFRGDGSAYLSGQILVSSESFTDTLNILASTGRIWASR